MQEQTIFTEALEKEDPAERAAFLEGACAGDARLRQRVERLLGRHDHAGSFLEQPVLSGDATTDHQRPISEQPGSIIGPYKLLQQIGEGGFGVVFEAEQERPVRRRVALKVIKPGMDTREVIARFEAERQALAMMDHPNIAKVHDAGTTGGESRVKSQEPSAKSGSSPALDSRLSALDYSAGRPYFVMELVQGVPITEYCDECNLTTRERLELFVTVCQAVQHAHQKGVIHRDIKPTNVLVAIQDGQPAPKIIDFGVAKAIGQQLTEHTLMTAFAQMVGTPLYMSPEQAELSPLGVDTRSDIYSLGVLLYELLTGSTPLDKDRLHAASYDELRRIIREEDPPRPSARISTLAADLATTVAEHRRTDSRRLRQTVRGELDWIVMKCLEKDRNRRYESAGGLARDVERYLADEPVQACPPSVSYRFRKFARRNKRLLAAGGAIAAALIVGLGLFTWQYFRAATESARARAVSELMREMLSSADKTQFKGDQYTVRELLDDFSAGLGNQLADQPAAAADIHDTIGGAYSMLGLQAKAERHLAKAVELRQQADGPEHENVAEALVGHAWTLQVLKRYAEAETHLRKALEIYRRRGVQGGRLVNAMSALQKGLLALGRDDEAKRVMDEAKAIADRSGDGYYDVASMLMRYANEQISQGEFAEAERLARQSINIQRSLPSKEALTGAWGLMALSRALQSQQKLEEAEQAARESLAILRRRYAPDHIHVRGAMDQLKSILTSRGDTSALESLAKAEADEANRSDSPGFHVRLARLLLTNQSPGSPTSDAVHQLIRRAIEEYGQVAVDSPDDMDRRMNAANGYIEVAKLCAAHPDFAPEINEAHRRLTTELERLLADFPDSTRCEEMVGHCYLLWASAVQPNSTYLPQVEHAYREAIKHFGTVLRDNPKPATNASADALYSIALMQLRLGDKSGYRATCKTLVNVPLDKLTGKFIARPVWTPCIGPGALDDPTLPVKLAEQIVANNSIKDSHYELFLLGAANYRAGQYEQAAQRLEQSIATPPSDSATTSLSYPRLFLTLTKWRQGHQDEARKLLAETLPAVDKERQLPSTDWNRRATLELLRDEATALIEPKKANEAVENKPRPDNERPSNPVEQASEEKREHQSRLIVANRD
jgi:serine/threonine protein kinase/tetratricopeptide (TPR) repeat protein